MAEGPIPIVKVSLCPWESSCQVHGMVKPIKKHMVGGGTWGGKEQNVKYFKTAFEDLMSMCVCVSECV